MPTCAHLTTLHLGKELHGHIISSLVDMYAKRENIRIARWIFVHMEVHGMVSRTAMIMAYALHGHAHDAIFLFKQMEMEGVKPNPGAFVAVLTACSHTGLMKLGIISIASFVILALLQSEHYAAVADLLGRVGRLQEAYDFFSKMHVRPTAGVWSPILAACRVHKNIDFAENVAGNKFRISPKNKGAYVFLSNIYSAAGRCKDAAKVRSKMGDKGMRKSPACSWTEVKNEMFAFVSALEVLLEQIEREGKYMLNKGEKSLGNLFVVLFVEVIGAANSASPDDWAMISRALLFLEFPSPGVGQSHCRILAHGKWHIRLSLPNKEK
ncbi:LOW QUALITY PROTEIN: E motif [Dillenia turbinata]|uniref:E motif n=1 Tax=Dillenia turbinata TaxID=194707 RepID=A0AAN8Z9K2_9MAGN